MRGLNRTYTRTVYHFPHSPQSSCCTCCKNALNLVFLEVETESFALSFPVFSGNPLYLKIYNFQSAFRHSGSSRFAVTHEEDRFYFSHFTDEQISLEELNNGE